MMLSYVPPHQIAEALSMAERLASQGRAAAELVHRLRAVRDNACADPACRSRCLAQCCPRSWREEA